MILRPPSLISTQHAIALTKPKMRRPELLTRTPTVYPEQRSRITIKKPTGEQRLTLHTMLKPLYKLNHFYVEPPDFVGVVGSIEKEGSTRVKFHGSEVLADIRLRPLDVDTLGPEQSHRTSCRKFNAIFNEQTRILSDIRQKYSGRRVLSEGEPLQCRKQRSTINNQISWATHGASPSIVFGVTNKTRICSGNDEVDWKIIELGTIVQVTGSYHLIEQGIQRKRSKSGPRMFQPDLIAYVIEARTIKLLRKADVTDWE